MEFDPERQYPSIGHAREFLRATGSLCDQIIDAAQELIGHSNPILDAEWAYYENVRRLCCPWVLNSATNRTGWKPFREAEAMFDNRAVVLELLGRDTPLELAFGVSAISSLSETGLIEDYLSYQPPIPVDEYHYYDEARHEAFSGLSDVISIITLGRQLKNMPETKPILDDELREYRRRLNKSAAEKRNEPFRQLHWDFRLYLMENKPKSIRNAAKLFYEALSEEQQIYQSVDHAIRNLSESLYGKRGKK